MKTPACLIILVFTGVVYLHPCNCQGPGPGNTGNQPDTITDIDGNVYHTISVTVAGTKTTWMAENLKVIHYRNGDPIPVVKDAKTWDKLTTGACCDYENKPNPCGKLYNWYAVADTRGICPDGWHAPSEDEWYNFVYSLGESVAGAKLREAGTAHWKGPNTGATNETGFTALPGGCRIESGLFSEKGMCCYWWTSTEFDARNAWIRKTTNFDTSVRTGYDYKKYGFSVRCVKDQ